MEVKALGYLGISASNLEGWKDYGTQFLGMQLVERTNSSLAFRMDDLEQRILVASDLDDHRGFYGWEVEGASALSRIATRVDSSGVSIKRLTQGECDQRRVKEGISFGDPAGNRVEVFYGAQLAKEDFRPARPTCGFRTGAMGLGHVVFTVERIDKVLPFYVDVLGFRLSDYFLRPFKAYFLHVNERHHSLAFVETGRNGVHHLMMELLSLDDIGQTYDIALGIPDRVCTTFGRHSNDHMTSFYAMTPSNMMVEYGWGGRSIDVNNWQSYEVTQGPSIWGHDRLWLPPEQQKEARDLRMRAAADGFHAPIEVTEGQYITPSNSCAWWRSVNEQRSARLTSETSKQPR